MNTVRRTSLARILSDRHKSAVRSFGYALAVGTEDGSPWEMLSHMLACRLTDAERAAVSWAAMTSLPDDIAAHTIEAAFPGAGMPIPLLGTTMEQATFWADRATMPEREAYCLATYNAMPVQRQAAFLEYVRGRRSA